MPGDDLPLFAAMPATIGDALASLNREHFCSLLSFRNGAGRERRRYKKEKARAAQEFYSLNAAGLIPCTPKSGQPPLLPAYVNKRYTIRLRLSSGG